MEKEIMELLKKRAKAQGFTQERLARNLAVSLPTVKRWYGGNGLTIANLKLLCDQLGCTLSEILGSVETAAPTSFSYTLAQETAFVKEPALLAFYDYLIRGKSVATVRSKFRLTEVETTAYLLKLDRLYLIDLHPSNRPKLKHSGEPTWLPGGPLSRYFRSRIIDEFVGDHEKSETVFYLHDYLEEDVLTLKTKLNDLEVFMKQAHRRALREAKSSQAYGVYFAVKKFRWSMDKFLDERGMKKK